MCLISHIFPNPDKMIPIKRTCRLNIRGKKRPCPEFPDTLQTSPTTLNFYKRLNPGFDNMAIDLEGAVKIDIKTIRKDRCIEKDSIQ